MLLIGPMGAGKSTVGRLLAARLAFPFVDLDEAIVVRAGKTIPAIFAEEGEIAFRRLESQLLAEQVGSQAVVATGGGAVLTEGNRLLLKAHPPVIWLDAPPEVLALRIAGDLNRPLLNGVDPLQKARELDAIRRPLYAECASLHLRTDQLKTHAAVAAILRFLSE